MSGGKIHKELQVTDNIIVGIFSNSHSTFFQMTQTKKNITRRVSKIYECIQGNVYEWGEVY